MNTEMEVVFIAAGCLAIFIVAVIGILRFSTKYDHWVDEQIEKEFGDRFKDVE